MSVAALTERWEEADWLLLAWTAGLSAVSAVLQTSIEAIRPTIKIRRRCFQKPSPSSA